MIEQDKNESHLNSDGKEKNNHKSINITPFQLMLMLLSAIILTAGVTAFALIGGNDRVIKDEGPKRAEFVKLYSVYDTLNSKYYKDVDKEKLIDGAIKGMVNGLDDPYSEYMTKKEQVDFTESMSGDFQGIGAEMAQDGNQIIITSPLKGSPAEKAGLKANDVLTKINGKSTHGMNTQDVVQKIRGKKGTEVTLTIKRGSEEPFKVKIKRDTIHVKSVETELKKDKTAVVTVNKFQEKTADEFHEALNDMKEQGMKRLVLDFRNNPGGYLDEASKMANEFLDKGDIVFYTSGKDEEKKAYKAPNPMNPSVKDIPVVIILNEGSASASEVFAEALRENDKAEIVGTKSFGKGIVQTAAPYKDKSMLKFTEMKWLTPDGNWIHKKGIKPDVESKLPAYAEIQILNPDEVFTEGEKGSKVKSLEIGLKALGYDPGKVDKVFDERTAEAVMNFQTDKNQEATGRMTGKTTEAFTNALRKKLLKEDTQMKKAIETVK